MDVLYFQDPELGPRKLPKYDDPKAGKVIVETDSRFTIDVEKQDVTFTSNGTKVKVGNTMAYIVH